ncbi:MAG: nucleotidyltransferase domain-containing protein [Pyrinomonadaceae bacterium]
MLIARPEDQILICVARRSLDVATVANLRQLLRRDLDWDYLLLMAQRHRVVPSLHHHLIGYPDAVPAQASSQLEQLNNENARSNLLLTGELLKLVDLLAAHGVAAVPFKGPTLALLAYGDVGRREFGDLDILVRKENVPTVMKVLARDGFTPRPELSSAHQTAILRFDCSHNFANERNVWVDVHWDFVAPSASVRVDTDKLWDRLEPLSVNRRELKTLSVEDLLLILCLHGFTHFWERLGWICDVAALIDSQEGIDWPMVLENADRMGSRRILSLGLYLTSNLLGASVPPDVWTKAPADATVLALADQVQQGLFTERPEPVGILGELRLHLAMMERKRDKLTSCIRLLAMPKVDDWKLLKLPGSLFFFYYALRPLRLAGKYAAKLLRVSADRETSTKGNEGVVS